MADDNETRIQEIQREYLDFLDDDVSNIMLLRVLY